MLLLSTAFVLCFLLQLRVENVDSLSKLASRCDESRNETFDATSCTHCVFNSFISCPSGSKKLTTGMGMKCTAFKTTGWLVYRLQGCVHRCQRTVTARKCCPGFWGYDCRPCPGIESGKACYGNGQCRNGKCQCNVGFEGFACEECSDKKMFGNKCQQSCTCKSGNCSSGVLGSGKCQPYTCKPGYYGENCNKFERNCSKTCHSDAHCVMNQRASCVCNPGYRGNGSHCKGINPCSERKPPCLSKNADCHYTGPGRHECVCTSGFTGDGLVCTAIDPCQYNYGNCPNNTHCNYQAPGKSNCSCQPGYHNYDKNKGCSMIDFCSNTSCLDVNADCYMVRPLQKLCRCKDGFVGNGTICYGNVLQRIDNLNRDGPYKSKFTLIKSLITRHTSLTRPFTGEGPFTVFIPTDDGVKTNFTVAQRSIVFKNTELASRLVLLHTVSGYLSTNELTKNGNLTTLNGVEAIVSKNSNFFYQLRGQPIAKIITTDIVASNGVIHVLDRPAWTLNITNTRSTSSLTLWQIINQKPELQTLREYVQIVGLKSELETSSMQGITFVAPVNDAFKALNATTAEFLKTSQGRVKLLAILRHHIFDKKIGIIEMIYKRTIQSRAPALVGVSVKDQGAVILADVAKLVRTNIPASNGVLHLSNALLIPTFVKPIHPRRCDVNSTNFVYSPCNSCSRRFINDNCPVGSISTGQKENCIYIINFVVGSIKFRGCRTKCIPLTKRCCPGFYGPNCATCPGPVGNPCFGNGRCVDDISGNGTCVCNSSFTGTACELCRNPKTFGLSCDKKCSCVHGDCDGGRYGNGSCLPGTCRGDYFGSECATMLQQCGFQRIPCSVNALCYQSKTLPRCVCKSGYEGDGANCYEIDPCQKARRGGCDRNAVCTKTGPGQSMCTCASGWTGDGTYCTPINYCATPSRGFCHKYAECTYLGPGKFNCVCRPGYKGDGISCQEINSCLIDNGNCSPLARCTKLGPGINDCKCRLGYTGNGYKCFPSLSVVMKERNELTIISRLLVKSNLVRYLSYPGVNLTVFVPSDTAMNESLKAILALPRNLLYFGGSNVARGLYPLSKLRNLTRLVSLFKDIYINISLSNASEIVIGGVAKVIVPDILASNGIIHIVDKVLLPPLNLQPPKEVNLYQGLCNQSSNFTEICKFIEKYNMESNLKNCSHCTIFAPPDQVFHDMLHSHYSKFNPTDLKYHITEHYIPPRSIKDGQQFSTFAGTYYVLTLEKHKKITVNGVPLTHYRSGSQWVIYNISSILAPTQNVCFKNSRSIWKSRCHTCWLRAKCPLGYRYTRTERCQLIFGVLTGCKTVCEKPRQDRTCCPGFWGKFCDACPGGSGNPCFGHGKCHETEKGSGACTCNNEFNGTACERCKEGYYGDKCKKCDCNSGTCDQKNGFCICPPNRKGLKCDMNTTDVSCRNTCHQHASCVNDTCYCDYGFTGNGTQCSHIDLCAANNGGCSRNAKCQSTAPGQRTCTCKNNYEGDGFYCQGVNPCRTNSRRCHPDAHCVYFRPGRMICVCNPGYIGNGTSCSPYNPCAENNGGCSIFAVCMYGRKNNMLSCRCREGYIGNGVECTGNLIESLQTNPNLTEFHSCLKKSGLEEILSPENIFSIIAPNNKAFTTSRRKRRSVSDFSEADLKYYVVSCVAINEQDVNVPGNTFVTVAGWSFNITSPGVINNDIKILSVKKTINGGILIVDRLVKPPASNLFNSSIPFIEAAKNNGYIKFIHLLYVTGMLDVVSNRYFRPFTMFWPTDEAIDRLPGDIKDRLLSGNYTSELRNILSYHIISQTKTTTKVILSYTGGLARRTKEGTSLFISCKGQKGDLYINDRSRIVQRDILFSEGIAFGIAEVLLPPGVAGRCDEITYEKVEGSCTVCNGTGLCHSDAILQGVDQTTSCYFQNKYLGCPSKCLQRQKLKKCCKNYYGPDCGACPGGLRSPCSGRGYCNDGVSGNGSCSCHEPYFGTACERCVESDSGCDSVDTDSKSCTSRKNPCSIFAMCNASAPQLCSCMDGYEGDGFYCQEIDPCQKNNGNCSPHAICTYLEPNSARCRCRPGYVGDGHFCSALPPSHPCATNNGNCHVHAKCDDKDGAAGCKCRDGFVGDGLFCGGTVIQVIYDIEQLSEFAKAFRNLMYGVEGSEVIRHLSSEMDYTVFAPINFGYTVKKMTIYELKNHIVQEKHYIKSGTKQTFLSLAGNNITVVVSKNKRVRINNIANVLYDFPATNGIIHVVDHTLLYTKPPSTSHPPIGTTKARKTSKMTTTSSPHIQEHRKNNHVAVVIGVVVGIVVLVGLVIFAMFYVKRSHGTAVVKYERNFESVRFGSEPYTDEDHVEEDDYQHPELQHPSADDRQTYITNPAYMDRRTSLDEHLEMTETSSFVPLTQHDASAIGQENSTDY